MTKYKVRNTTSKEPIYDKNGRDLRSLEEKVGHLVGFTDSQGNRIRLHPNKEVILNEITNGLLNLQNEGLVHISALDSVTTLLKDHVKGEEPVKKAKRVVKNGQSSRKKAAKS